MIFMWLLLFVPSVLEVVFVLPEITARLHGCGEKGVQWRCRPSRSVLSMRIGGRRTT